MNKVLVAVRKASFVFAGLFTVSIVWFSFCMMEAGFSILPRDILIIFRLFFLLAVITAYRYYIADKNWILKLPFFVKNLIFAPVYFVITLVSVLNLSGMQGYIRESVTYVSLIFGVTFIISSYIKYMIEKSKADNMNNALIQFQKEHFDE